MAFCIGLGLLACAVARSAVATRLDDLNEDEPYHITAGISYVQLRDYRINPEHPPLVKVWVGLGFIRSGFHLSSFRQFGDKNDEREFTEFQVFTNNDPDWIQRRARVMMFILNASLLFIVFLTVRRTFNDDAFAAACLAFLVIDPTIAAHMPVVLTDLPLALLSITAVLCAVVAFRTWRLWDLLLTAAALGLVLAVKHSGLVTCAMVLALGAMRALFTYRDGDERRRAQRLGYLALVVLGAVVVLWSFYLFRFRESPDPGDYFNRSFEAKISDVRSPFYRGMLKTAASVHLLPRAYIWGLADTIRAGAEGRAETIFFLGKSYYSRAPFYFFPTVLAVKIPIGLLVLVAMGLYLLATGRVPTKWSTPILSCLGFAVFLLVVLASGSSYAGIRHALPIVPVLALCAALAAGKMIRGHSVVFRAIGIVAVATALISAIPVMRPWEYYNGFVGGPANSSRYFNDEGLDMVLRGREVAQYYHQHLEPLGVIPYITYPMPDREKVRRGIRWIGQDPVRDRDLIDADVWSGTIICSARGTAPYLWWDRQALRSATPAARFGGNLLVFQGSFPARPMKAQSMYYRALDFIYTSHPDWSAAQQLLSDSIALDPKAFFVSIELGNVEVRLGERSAAVAAYSLAKQYAVRDEDKRLLAIQVALASSQPLESLTPLRNPEIE